LAYPDITRNKARGISSDIIVFPAIISIVDSPINTVLPLPSPLPPSFQSFLRLSPSSSSGVTLTESEAKPVSDAKPVSEAKPASETEPVSETKPVSEAKPASEAKPVSETKPVSEAEPVSETEMERFWRKKMPEFCHADRNRHYVVVVRIGSGDEATYHLYKILGASCLDHITRLHREPLYARLGPRLMKVIEATGPVIDMAKQRLMPKRDIPELCFKESCIGFKGPVEDIIAEIEHAVKIEQLYQDSLLEPVVVV
jgi:hypothetical protein